MSIVLLPDPLPTLIENVQQLLLTLEPAGGVWYGVNTTEPPVYPYIVHTRIVSTANATLQGPSDLQNTRVQVDVVARTIAEADALQKRLADLMATWSVANVPLSSVDLYEEAVKAWRISSDWSIWATT